MSPISGKSEGLSSKLEALPISSEDVITLAADLETVVFSVIVHRVYCTCASAVSHVAYLQFLISAFPHAISLPIVTWYIPVSS